VEALEAYRSGKADVMFLDLTMPVMDGYQVLAQLQKEELNTFVVVITADIQPEAQERVKKLGAMAFIKKPVKTEDINNVLHEFGIV
jgi:CheY-like chemotaxis protein